MPLNQLLPTLSQLSHQDKLRLIHFLLVEVAKEEELNLVASSSEQEPENTLLEQLATTEAVMWSPYDAHEAAQTLSDLLVAEKQKGNAG